MTTIDEHTVPQPAAEELARIYQPPRIVHKRELKQFSGSPLVVDPGSPDALGLPK